MLCVVWSNFLFIIGFTVCFATQMISDGTPFTLAVNLNTTPDFEFNFVSNPYNITDTNFDDVKLRHSERYEHLRRRKKEERLIFIRTQIMERLGSARRPSNMSNTISEDERNRIVLKFQRLQTQVHDNDVEILDGIYAERVQSFYPSCSVPRNTERGAWESGEFFHLYYDVTSPRHALGTTINVSSAKLRLYKNSNGLDYTGINLHGSVVVEATENLDENLLRVTVFQYLRPLRKNRRVKKKLLDSKVVSSHHEGWIEFNIRPSIRDWFENSQKNFGLEVVLEDIQEISKNPAFFFQNMNCSEHRTNDPPFPRFMEDDSITGENESSLYDNETYPTLDLRTIEFKDGSAISVLNVTEQRRKRHATNCDATANKCCLETTYVSFKELGWEDWLLKPDGFHLSYCFGMCENTQYENTDGIPDDLADGNCLPSEYEPVALSYTDDENNSYYSIVDDFIIWSCSCSNEE